MFYASQNRYSICLWESYSQATEVLISQQKIEWEIAGVSRTQTCNIRNIVKKNDNSDQYACSRNVYRNQNFRRLKIFTNTIHETTAVITFPTVNKQYQIKHPTTLWE